MKNNNKVASSFVIALTFYSLIFVFLVGCSTTYAPVEHRHSTSYDVKKKHTGKTPTYHRVRKGETLYSIAWRYSQDYKNIAYRNNIKPPYKIYVGNKIRLIKTARKTNTNKAKVYSNKSRKYSSSKTKKSKKTSSKKVALKTTKTKSKNNKRVATKKNKAATFTGSKRLRWSWPVKGKVIQRFSPGSGKKGIDISAAQGILIKSAEAGKVVYSGQGLVGYGRLIIIKHNETYLSAYAHNQSLLVNEGQVVKKGQGIARLGRSGTNRYKLHFEIRKNGTPVNPISYLPRK
ncbi:peptidoglycan DD-metalloendopeptidase family protein [sulfur-oxidizing endosymbiont of Gigantopelta aegis]|uniref:peptidoglycan DD-metalloendopeptidase family protein n=1 Tax=sulfur-oxidizing endosymbiont of Gigantopelta aegis TaxID=2794934 RepID=UPI001BE4856F|nr:peptidoglycan DD-metalloendopeptidase family protein [sulfur-oxidizing endosymbiont of Gigantopelta aegis]